MPLAWTTRKQLSYLGVVVVFALIVLIGTYAAFQSPTCSDGAQNQDETSVDCGGICGECIGAARPLPRAAGEADRAYQYRLPRVEIQLVSEVY